MPTVECGFVGGAARSTQRALVVHGPTLLVQIGFDLAFRSGRGAPNLLMEPLPALVDTGAAESRIDSALAMELELPVIDRTVVAAVHGRDEVNMHLAQIHVPEIQVTVIGPFAGVHLRAGGQPHCALIGRTFLQHFAMTYRGTTGSVSLSNDGGSVGTA